MVTTAEERIRLVRIDEEMRSSYLSYAMSVIVSRALPDVRDGLKPVQRRILYAMQEIGLGRNSAYKKCARIVGEVLGKYHPHGDSPVYDALVRMAQNFSLRYTLIDGQGNFGSIDDDPPAAMRYTEARLASIAEEMLADIEQDTVDFAANFDGSMQEPTVLPGRLPNLLVNGVAGIAVGMATSIPPHNLGEICSAICYLIDHPDAYVEDLLEIVKGPDFPTGAVALVGKGKDFTRQVYSTGHGRVVMRAKAGIEDQKGSRRQIVISELPYQVNKASLVARIAQLTRDKKIEGISDVRDESDREGLRVVVELKRDAQEQVVLDSLYKHTAMQSSFNVIMLALVNGQPQVLSLKRALQLYIQHRQEIISRRSQFLLKRAKDRVYIVEGLRIALQNLDMVIQLIRNARDAETARKALVQQLKLSEVQAQAILDLQLRRLAALERQKLEDEYKQLLKTIGALEALLADPAKVLADVRQETEGLKRSYPSPRLTQIVEEEPTQHSLEELTQQQDVVITLSRRGYIKRIPTETYKLQHRGGRGVRGMTTRDNDALQDLVVADTHDRLLLFTDRGRAYVLRCFEVPGDASRTGRGTSLKNLVSLGQEERVNAVVAAESLDAEGYLVLATRLGEVKTLRLRDLANMRSNGLVVMDLENGDELVSVRRRYKGENVILVTSKGQSIRFVADQIPRRSRAAGGVRGIRLDKGDVVVGMEVIQPNERLLVISAHGYGKLVSMEKYPRQRRGGRGVLAFKVTEKTGELADARAVPEGEKDEVFLVSAQCQVIRIGLEEISVQGRNASGVTVWRPDRDDRVASIACFQDNHKA